MVPRMRIGIIAPPRVPVPPVGYSGTELVVDPHLPASWEVLRVRCRFRDVPVQLEIDHEGVSVRAERPIPVRIDGDAMTAPAGQTLRAPNARPRDAEVAR